MLHVRNAGVRLLTSVPLTLALALTLLAGYTLSPAAPEANAALISARKADDATDWARTRKGSPYVWGADGPRRFDCSGLTRWAYKKVGRLLPHSSAAQVGFTKRIQKEDRRRGDLMFFYSRSGVYHVAIYAGQGYMWDAPRPGERVQRIKPWTSRVFYGRVK